MTVPHARESTEQSESSSNQLIFALQNPDIYDHLVSSFELIETHISWVILTGQFAYKIKKPVNFGFVDFSSLEKRKFYCNEELRLNRRFASDLYEKVISITGSLENPSLNGNGDIIEYAVKMKEFSQAGLLSEIATEHKLQVSHIDSMANVVATFHTDLAKVALPGENTAIEIVMKWSGENFLNIEKTLPKTWLPHYFKDLKTWCLILDDHRITKMKQRVENGFIRECHGDLHLGNIAIINNQVTLFDCIEFNSELRWIDTISEVAFIVMDLFARGYSEFAWRFINHYFASTGDYEGVALLRFYIVYRAMVRAKVNALRAMQEDDQDTASINERDECLRYLDLAQFWKKTHRPAIIVMHGLSGSGKSTLASQLVEQLGAIQIRSDSERKRLFDLESHDDSASQLDQGIYTKDATQLTYDRLAQLTQIIISAGFTAIVDASFLKLNYRYQFKQLALKNQVAHLVVSCEQPEAVLRKRIRKRNKVGKDPSEASIEVLQKQLQTQDVLCTEELTDTFTVICTEGTLNTEQLQAIKGRIAPTENISG